MSDWISIFLFLFSVALRILYIAAIVGTVFLVVLDKRSPIKSISWILVLIFLPVVGLILYYFFGRSQRKVRIITKKSYSRLLKKPMAEYLAQKEVSLPLTYEQQIKFLKNTNQAFPFEGNRVEIYTTGAEMLQSLLAELEKATHHIHLLFYIFEADEVGRQVSDVLMRKAKEGVQVRVVYDDVGCWKVPNRFFEEMREAGVETRAFLKVRFPMFAGQVNYRNHRKIVVIDGKIGFVGGMNLAERYLNGCSWGVWRDTHLLIEGKAVHGLQTAFLLDWFFVDQSLFTSSIYFPKIENKGNLLAQIVTTDPIGPWKEIMQGMILAIGNARHYIYMQTPYFLPTESMLIALRAAAASGVDVRLMLPRKADSWLINQASRSYMDEMLDAGVKVFLYEKGFLHAKMIVSDDYFSTLGSTNIDFRSFEHNFEVNAFLYDKETALRLREIFVRDQKDSTQLYMKNWQKRPWYKKVTESVVRLLSPLL